MRRTKNLLALIAAGLVAGTASIYAQTELINPTTTPWRYSADNSDQYAAGFPLVDDSAWPEGLGLFGTEGTVYRYPIVTPVPPQNAGGPTVSYYRARFNWVGAATGVVLTLTNFIDDGIIVYLNGTEITRWNVNAATHTEQAPVANPGGEPVTVVHQAALDGLTNGMANPLIPGENILAVSVHQAGTASSDIVFGMSLHSSQVLPPCTPTVAPAVIAGIQCKSATFTATLAADCGVPSPTLQWFKGVDPIPGANGLVLTLNNLTAADAGTYTVTATNPGGSRTSTPVTLNYSPDTQGPVILSAVAITATEILVTFDEAWATGGADDAFTWEIYQDGVILSTVDSANIVANSPNQILLVHSLAITPGSTYTYITSQSIADTCAGNETPAGATGPIQIPGPISVGATGSAVYDFGTPPYKEEFATFTWAGGANGVGDTAGAMDAKVQLLDVAVIATTSTALPSATGNPPAAGGTAVWASDGRNLATRPTGTEGSVILVTLVNNSGAARSGLELRYDMGSAVPVVEEIPGYLVYFSTSGSPSTWIQIPTISGDGTAGAKVGTIDLSGSPWAVGSLLYVLFADDNGSGSPDIAYSIDNFSVVPVSVNVTPVAITQQPLGAAVTEGDSFTLTVTASGSSPQYQWTKDGVDIPGATSSSFTAVSDASSAGVYRVRVSNSANSVTSDAATVVIRRVVVPYGTSWKYETNCLDATLTGTPWYATAFNDSAWQSGVAPFGLETTAATIARIPAIVTPLPPPAATFVTAYFRTPVTIPALAAGESLYLTHVIDDGMAFYVDGTLAFVYNMNGGVPIDCSTVAVAAAPPDGDARKVTVPIALAAGTRNLAVEVHQNSATSSDVVFAMEISRGPAFPRLTITHPTPTTVVVSWAPSAGVRLLESATVNGNFTAVAGNPQGSFTATLVPGNNQRFFRLGF